MNHTSTTPEQEALAAVLADMKQRRGGFLLPHHGLLGLLAPNILGPYDALYSRVALTDGPFSEFEKEYIWLAIIVTGREAIGTHHLHKFRAAATSPGSFHSVLRLVALVEGSDAIRFPADSWRDHTEGFDWGRSYIDGLVACCADTEVPEPLMHLAAAGVATCHRLWPQLVVHLEALYAAKVPERHMLEAISFALLPGGVPSFINACAVWQDAIRSGRLPGSDITRFWAQQDLSGFGKVRFPSASPPA